MVYTIYSILYGFSSAPIKYDIMRKDRVFQSHK